MQGTRTATKLGNVVIAYDRDRFTRGGLDLVEAAIGALRRSQLAAFSMPRFREASVVLSADQHGCAGVIVPAASGADGRPGQVAVIRDDNPEDLAGLFAKIAEHLWEQEMFA